jgi:hypothetical protein
VIGNDEATDLQVERPRVARVYGSLHGDGKDTFASERAARDRIVEVLPDAPVRAAQMSRYAQAVACYMAEAGMQQVVDIGAGIPTTPSLTDLVCAASPTTRVWSVDLDPVVLVHLRAQPWPSGKGTVVEADARDPEVLLDALTAAGVEFTRPVGVVLAGILHSVTGDDCGGRGPAGIVHALRHRMCDGSMLAISHVCSTGSDLQAAAVLSEIYAGMDLPLIWRPRSDIESLFEGFTLVAPPGLSEPTTADVAQWELGVAGERDPDSAVRILAGIGALHQDGGRG